MNRIIFLVDMEAFYASVEKIRNPSLANKPVAVVGDPERRSGVILAACPIAKKQGRVKTGTPLWEALNTCPDLVMIKPTMQYYIDVSIGITAIMEQYTDLVEPFSIDEMFMDVSSLCKTKEQAEEVAARLQRTIKQAVGINIRVGIGNTKILAKMACDLAKKRPGGVLTIQTDDLEALWERPIGDMFGVGKRMEQHLTGMGIRTIGHLANYPLDDLVKRWGINGRVLHNTAWGIDEAPVTPQTHEKRKGISHGITLPKDYKTWQEIKVVLRELCEEVAARSRDEDYMGSVASIGVGGSYDSPYGFSRQVKLQEPTNDGKVIYRAVESLFKKHWEAYPVRSLGVSLGKLKGASFRQLSLFEPIEDREELNRTMDAIRHQYGKGSIMFASSISVSGQALERAKKIGGHYK